MAENNETCDSCLINIAVDMFILVMYQYLGAAICTEGLCTVFFNVQGCAAFRALYRNQFYTHACLPAFYTDKTIKPFPGERSILYVTDKKIGMADHQEACHPGKGLLFEQPV